MRSERWWREENGHRIRVVAMADVGGSSVCGRCVTCNGEWVGGFLSAPGAGSIGQAMEQAIEEHAWPRLTWRAA